jgi:hypothetical protein
MQRRASTNCVTACPATQRVCGSSPEVKRSRNESNHLASSSVESKNMLIHTSTSPHTFTAPRRSLWTSCDTSFTCPVFNLSHPYKTTAFGHRPMSEAHVIHVTCWRCRNPETSSISENGQCPSWCSHSQPSSQSATHNSHISTHIMHW